MVVVYVGGGWLRRGVRMMVQIVGVAGSGILWLWVEAVMVADGGGSGVWWWLEVVMYCGRGGGGWQRWWCMVVVMCTSGLSKMADMFCPNKKIRFGFLEVLNYSLTFIVLLSLVGITCSIRCQHLSSAVTSVLCSPPITAAVYTGRVSVGDSRSIFSTRCKLRQSLNSQRLFRPVL